MAECKRKSGRFNKKCKYSHCFIAVVGTTEWCLRQCVAHIHIGRVVLRLRAIALRFTTKDAVEYTIAIDILEAGPWQDHGIDQVPESFV